MNILTEKVCQKAREVVAMNEEDFEDLFRESTKSHKYYSQLDQGSQDILLEASLVAALL